MMDVIVVHTVITGLERLRQEEHEFKTIWGYTVSSRSTHASLDTVVNLYKL